MLLLERTFKVFSPKKKGDYGQGLGGGKSNYIQFKCELCGSFILCSPHLSTKAWWRRNMGSFAELCTEDIDPFMKTWTAACIPIRELFPKPVFGSPNPAGSIKC